MVYLIKDGQIVTQNNVPIWLPDGVTTALEDCCCGGRVEPCWENPDGYWRVVGARYYSLCRPIKDTFDGYVVIEADPSDYIREESTEEYSCKVCKTLPNLTISPAPFAGSWEDIIRAAVTGTFENDCSDKIWSNVSKTLITYWNDGGAFWQSGNINSRYFCFNPAGEDYIIGNEARENIPVYYDVFASPSTYTSKVRKSAEFTGEFGTCCGEARITSTSAYVEFLFSDAYTDNTPSIDSCDTRTSSNVGAYSSSFSNFNSAWSGGGDPNRGIFALPRTSPFDISIVFALEKVE